MASPRAAVGPSVDDIAAFTAPALLRLPDETLLQIASKVEDPMRNSALRSLSLTCRRFRPIAREALLQTCVLRYYCIPKLLQFLDDHPTFASKLSHIEVGLEDDFACTQVRRANVTGRCTTRMASAFCEIMEETSAPTNERRWEVVLGVDYYSDWGYSAMFSVIMGRASNLKSISLDQWQLFDLPSLLSIFEQSIASSHRRRGKDSDSIANPLSLRLLDQLETIDITIGIASDLNWDRCITLHRFRKLKRACVPIDRLVWQYPTSVEAYYAEKLQTRPRDVLPRSLTYLKLDCRKQTSGRFPVDWVRNLLLDTDEALDSLRTIQFQFFGNYRGFRRLFFGDHSTRGTRIVDMRNFLQETANKSPSIEAVYSKQNSYEVVEVYSCEEMLTALETPPGLVEN